MLVPNMNNGSNKHNKALVFVHGIRLGGWCFEEHFLPYYKSKGYETHAVTLPGHSEHDRETIQRYSLEDYAEAVHSFCQQLDKEVILIGHSMGGAVLQSLISKYERLSYLKGVILLASAPPKNNFYFTMSMLRELSYEDLTALASFIRGEFHEHFFVSPAMKEEVDESKISSWISRMIPESSKVLKQIFWSDAAIEKKPGFLPPILVIGAKQDCFFKKDCVEFIASYYETCPVFVDIGHGIPFEPQWMKVAVVIDDWIKNKG